jgi:hypothetical protein
MFQCSDNEGMAVNEIRVTEKKPYTLYQDNQKDVLRAFKELY